MLICFSQETKLEIASLYILALFIYITNWTQTPVIQTLVIGIDMRSKKKCIEMYK